MASRVYSTRFLRAALVAAGTTDFVVPVAYRAVVKDISVLSGGAATTLTVGTPGGPNFARFDLATIGAMGRWTGMQVFDPGETIRATAVAGASAVWVSGYLLLLP